MTIRAALALFFLAVATILPPTGAHAESTGDLLTDRGFDTSRRPWVPSDRTRGAEAVKPIQPFMNQHAEIVRPATPFVAQNADMFDHMPRPYAVPREEVVRPRPATVPDYPLFHDRP